MVAAAAGLVLLVAFANVANLILVRADGRQRELAVRAALGAGRVRVLSHFLAETVLLAGVSGALGIAVAWIAVRALVIAGPADIPRLAELRIDVPTVMFAVAVSLLAALVTSAIPAWRVGRVPLSNALREGGRGGTAGKAQQRLRGAMVSVQIALALVVLAGSGLLLRTFQRLNAVRPIRGRQHGHLLAVAPARSLCERHGVVRFWSSLTERALLPGVRRWACRHDCPCCRRDKPEPVLREDDPDRRRFHRQLCGADPGCSSPWASADRRADLRSRGAQPEGLSASAPWSSSGRTRPGRRPRQCFECRAGPEHDRWRGRRHVTPPRRATGAGGVRPPDGGS
jgi:hypothetical protein